MLKLADTLKLPIDAVTQKFGWLGTTGSGKTYGATKLAELFWELQAQFLVLDPVGVWYGLRLAKDGTTPSKIRIPIFGGLHGDVPLEPTSGGLIADLVVDQRISAILDVSQFEHDTDKARFATGFADRFFFRQKAAPAAVHLFLEECQEFVPENHQRGEERMKHAFTRMQKIGRNYGIGTSLISQRPQEVSKKALNLAQTLFVFRTTGTHERKAIETWIKDKAIEGQDIAQELPKLKTGAPHVWSPEWLEMSSVVHILEKKTFNASATPEVGAAATARELAEIDLDKVRKDMAAAIERAKADDPRELKKMIAELRKELGAKVKGQSPTPEPKAVATFVLKDGQLERAEALVERAIAGIMAYHDRLQKTVDGIHVKADKPLEELRSIVDGITAAIEKTRQTAPVQSVRPQHATRTPPQAASARRNAPSRPQVDGITPAKQRILNALAFFEGIGLPLVDKVQLALMAGVPHTSGGYKNNLGALRSDGLIDYPTPGDVALTAGGRAVAVVDGVPTTTGELHDTLAAKLPLAKWRLVEECIRIYPKSIEKDALAEAVGVPPTSGGYKNNLGSLRTLGLIDYPQPGFVQAQPVLFLEGA